MTLTNYNEDRATKRDLKTIEEALKEMRSLTRNTKYGGLYQLYQRTNNALDALARISHTVETHQLRLL